MKSDRAPWPKPLKSSPARQAALKLALAKFHRKQGREAYAAKLEREVRDLGYELPSGDGA